MTDTTAPTTYAIGDAVVIFRDGFEGTRKLFVDDIVDDGETVEYTLRHDYGPDYIGFFKAEELKPYEGSDLQWKREGKAMYAALKAENERLKADLDGCEDTLANAVIDHAAPSVTVHEQALDTATIAIGTRVIVEYEGAWGYIPRGKRHGVVIGHRGRAQQYVVVQVDGVNVPKSYLASAVEVVADAAEAVA